MAETIFLLWMFSGCAVFCYQFLYKGNIDRKLTARQRRVYLGAVLFAPIIMVVAVVWQGVLFLHDLKEIGQEKLNETSERRNPIKAKFKKKG